MDHITNLEISRYYGWCTESEAVLQTMEHVESMRKNAYFAAALNRLYICNIASRYMRLAEVVALGDLIEGW